MSSSVSLPKRTVKSLFEEFSVFDLFYQITYMLAVSAAGLSRRKIFELGAKLPGSVAPYMAKVAELVTNLQYDYPSACRLVATQSRELEVRSFLLRLADALESGEPLRTYLAREAAAQGDTYGNRYERDVESLKKWTDAYSSLIISEALLIIINLVSTLIYGMSPGLIAGLMTIAVLMGFFGAWVLSRATPREVMIIPSPGGSRDQLLARRLLTIVGPAALSVTLLMLLLGSAWPWAVLAGAVLLMPVGVLSIKSDSAMSKKENEISSFLRSLGGMATSTGSTLTEALGRMELESFPALAQDINRLTMRLRARIAPHICWHRFAEETGSQLIKQVISIFENAVSLGGDPDDISEHCSLFTIKITQLRAARKMVSSTFLWLTIVMHAVLSLLLALVLEIVLRFKALVEATIDPEQIAMVMQAVEAPLLTFEAQQVIFLRQMVIGMVILMVFINSIALIVTDGGFKPKICLYSSILFMTSALSFLIAPLVIGAIM